VHVLQRPALLHPTPAGACTPPPVARELRAELERDLSAVIERLAPHCEVSAHVVEVGNVSDGLAKTAAELDADLVVMGTRGRTGLAHALLGSVAERMLRLAPCPVLAVRAGADGDTAAEPARSLAPDWAGRAF
jgi:nucleotide-binding universal stress UspA family protein